MGSIYQKIMDQLGRLTKFAMSPVSLFVTLQIVSLCMTTLWVLWYLNTGLEHIERFDLAFLLAGCALIAAIAIGTSFLFINLIQQKRLNNMQRSFISSVTHELRSPIASMQLSLETLSQPELDQTLRQKMQTMIASDVHRLLNLVDQILVSARLDQGLRLFNELEEFKTSELFSEVTQSMSHLDAKIEDRLFLSYGGDLSIFGARSVFKLIIQNLLENAVKYSPPESHINAELLREANELVIKIKDHGYGLEKDEMKKIFKIFHRGRFAEQKAIRGTGLGLHIVKSFTTAMGGKVWAESEGKNKGSTFYVSLPLSEESCTRY
jgi:signal transduction histidine kinase